MLNVPVNNFSVMLGWSHRFLGITSTFFFFEGGRVNRVKLMQVPGSLLLAVLRR